MVDDLISQLPSDILISILVRTPTKEAVRTSVLSKKWRNLYRLLPIINLACHCNCRPIIWDPLPCDSKLITHGLLGLSHLHSGFIHSVEYRCCLNESSCGEDIILLEKCFSSLGDSCIEKLILQFFPYDSTDFSFPLHLLAYMPSLKYCKLKYCSLHPGLKNNHFNSLQSLKLSCVKLLPGSLECVLANCLSLSSLLIKDCFLPSKLCFRSSSHLLKCILIDNPDGIQEFQLQASDLFTFGFNSSYMVDIIFGHVPQLQRLSLSMQYNYSYCRRLLKDLPQLQSLLVDLYNYRLTQENSISKGNLMFSNLHRLDLTAILKFNPSLMIPLLHDCPLLEELHLATRAPVHLSRLCVGTQISKHVKIHPHLKKVDISGYVGTEDQYGFVAYLLKSCVVLQQMCLSWHCNVYKAFDRWEMTEYYTFEEKQLEEFHEHTNQLKHQALSKTAEVIFQKFPRITKWKHI